MQATIKTSSFLPSSLTLLTVASGVVSLGQTAAFSYTLSSKDGATSISGRAELTPDQYNGWVGSDEYIIRCIAANLGIEIDAIVAPVEAPAPVAPIDTAPPVSAPEQTNTINTPTA